MSEQPPPPHEPNSSLLLLLNPDLWQHTLAFLDERGLCTAARVGNPELRKYASADRLWEPRYEQLWHNKQGRTLWEATHEAPALSWKAEYGKVARDAKRRAITRAEICHYQWKLLYNRRESNLGLRRFGADGTYHSPYFGVCEWTLQDASGGGVCHLWLMGMCLEVERDPETWGWIIGKGSSTVYCSVDE